MTLQGSTAGAALARRRPDRLLPVPVKPSEMDLNDGPAKGSELFLVDANGLVFRAFFALPEELVTTYGFPTNALLGFTNMLMKLLADYTPRGVHRRLGRAARGAARARPRVQGQPPADARPAARAAAALQAARGGLRLPQLLGAQARGRRRDRHALAASPTRRASRPCIVSTDRDAFQLVSERVCLMMTPRGVADVHVYTPERVETRLGMPRELVPDLIGLKGDPGDNIQGVPGIGDKTAADLLREFGSLEGVYENLDRVSGAKRKETLAEPTATWRSRARSSARSSATWRSSTDLDLSEIVNEPPDRSKLADMFRALEFRDLLRRLDELGDRTPLPRPVSGPATPLRLVQLPELAERAGRAPEAGAGGRRRAPGGRARRRGAGGGGGCRHRGAGALDGPGLVAHDFKSLPHALLAGGPGAGLRLLPGGLPDRPRPPTYALDDLLAEAGIGIEIDGPEQLADVGRAALAPGAPARAHGGAPRGAPPDAPAGRHRAAAGRRARAPWRTSACASTPTCSTASACAWRPRSRSSRTSPTPRPAASSRSARRSSSARCCSRSWACPPTARARRATRPTSACWPRSATCTRSSPWSSAGAS